MTKLRDPFWRCFFGLLAMPVWLVLVTLAIMFGNRAPLLWYPSPPVYGPARRRAPVVRRIIVWSVFALILCTCLLAMQQHADVGSTTARTDVPAEAPAQ